MKFRGLNLAGYVVLHLAGVRNLMKSLANAILGLLPCTATFYRTGIVGHLAYMEVALRNALRGVCDMTLSDACLSALPLMHIMWRIACMHVTNGAPVLVGALFRALSNALALDTLGTMNATTIVLQLVSRSQARRNLSCGYQCSPCIL